MSQEERQRRREARQAREQSARMLEEAKEMNFASSRVMFDASRQGNPIYMEVSSDGGKTWAVLPTSQTTIRNDKTNQRSLIEWQMWVLPPKEGQSTPFQTELRAVESTNMIPADPDEAADDA